MDGPRIFPVVLSNKTRRQQAETDAQKVPSEPEEEIYFAGDCALAKSAQKGCGVSLTREIQEPYEYKETCSVCSRMTLPKQGGWIR